MVGEGLDAVIDVGDGGVAAYQCVVARGPRAAACSIVVKMRWRCRLLLLLLWMCCSVLGSGVFFLRLRLRLWV